jgi:hypothetical protein
MYIEKTCVSHNVLKYMLKENLITEYDILLYRKALFHLPNNLLLCFVEEGMKDVLREKYGDLAKKFINVLFGSFGTKYTKEDRGFITTDFETVCAMYSENMEGFSFSHLNGLYFVRNTTQQRKLKDHAPIFRQIISQGWIMIFELLKQLYVPFHSKLVGYNTDAVFIENLIENYEEIISSDINK